MQSPIFDIVLQRILWTTGAEFWETERGLSQKHSYLQKNISILHIYHRLIYTSVSLDPKFSEFLGQNAQMKDVISDWDASSSLKSCYQIQISLLCHHKSIEIAPNKFISFEWPLFKFY